MTYLFALTSIVMSVGHCVRLVFCISFIFCGYFYLKLNERTKNTERKQISTNRLIAWSGCVPFTKLQSASLRVEKYTLWLTAWMKWPTKANKLRMTATTNKHCVRRAKRVKNVIFILVTLGTKQFFVALYTPSLQSLSFARYSIFCSPASLFNYK